jgi:hypothetical protein
MTLGTQADRVQQVSGADGVEDVDAESARLFEDAVAGITSGRRPPWLPAWAFRRARAITRRRTAADGWVGGHLGFVEDLALREAWARRGLDPGPRVPAWRRGPAPSNAERRSGERHPDAG